MIEQLCQLAREAGEAILSVYHKTERPDIRIKQDASPVTEADLAAHDLISKGLAALSSEIPILSEEDPPSWAVRQNWSRYWLVDPLDGTKEFIHRNGEFTVNIALIEHGRPVMGVVYAPVLEVMYFANHGEAWREDAKGKVRIQAHSDYPPVVLLSRSHFDTELQHYLQEIGEYQTCSIGSSLKFCLIAEGKAQLYPRLGPTHIWDTAAGHAVAEASGAKVTDWQGKDLDYRPRESLLNPGFKVTVD